MRLRNIRFPLFVFCGVLMLSFVRAADPEPDSKPASPDAPMLSPARLYNEATQALPDWWKFGLEIRGRWDTFSGTAGSPGKFDSYYMSRLRISSTFTIRPWLRVFAQAGVNKKSVLCVDVHIVSRGEPYHGS